MNEYTGGEHILVNRYRLLELAGCGGISCVYAAFDSKENRKVAAKLLRRDLQPSPDQIQHFLAGARFGAQLSHPHLVKTLDHGEDPQHGPFWIMEFLEGESLDHHIRNLPELPESFVRAIGSQVASCLMHIHEHDMLHGDIKPENIILTRGPFEPWAVVLDFVPMRRIDDWLSLHVTREYLPPEIFSGAKPNPAADAFALGVLLHELTFGTLPSFLESGELALPLERRTISPTLAAFLFGLLSFTPRDRLIALADLARMDASGEFETAQPPVRPQQAPILFEPLDVLNQHPFGILMLDSRLVITWVNDSARKWLGSGMEKQRFHVTPLAFMAPEILGDMEETLETGRIATRLLPGTQLVLWISPLVHDQLIHGIVCTLCPTEMHDG